MDKTQLYQQILSHKKTIGRFMGYSSKPMPAPIVKKLEEELGKISDLLDPEYEVVLHHNQSPLEASIIYTIGHRIQEQIKIYMDQFQSLRALILDKAAIVALDQLREYIFQELRRETGLFVVKEMYPGSKALPLSAQKDILESMKQIITISINESYQLYPIKTVALKVLLGPSPGKSSRCEDCQNPCEAKDIQNSKDCEDYTLVKEQAKKTLKLYEQKGIPKAIYDDTLSDIEVWAQDCKEKHGYYGIKDMSWIHKTLNLQLFKLGRLQFEVLEGDLAAYWMDLAKVTSSCLILNTHIQAGAPLDPHRCVTSYDMALRFYQEMGYVFSNLIFVCESWLLNPDLHRLLNENDRILLFQKPYTPISTNDQDRQIEERVFGELHHDPRTYPQETRLQKNLRSALIQGQSFGVTKGYFLMKNE